MGKKVVYPHLCGLLPNCLIERNQSYQSFLRGKNLIERTKPFLYLVNDKKG